MRSFVAGGGSPLAGRAPFVTGVDLTPIDDERDGRRGWYARDVAPDLDALAEAGVGLVRVYVSWPIIEPQVGVYDDDAMSRLHGVVRASAQRAMRSVVCLFGDDRLSDLSVAPWATGRDSRTDPYLVERACALVTEVVGYLDAEEGVVGWQIADEAFLAGFESDSDLARWWGRIAEAVREADPERPIVFGGCVETLAHTPGIDARPQAEAADVSVAHATSWYRSFMAEGHVTVGRPTWLEGFLLHQGWGRPPALLDMAGPSSPELTVGEEAAQTRLSLWTGLVNGASGVLIRRHRDLRTKVREPFAVDPAESLVGISDEEGRPKPAMQDVATLARLVEELDLASYERFPERVAVLQPLRRFGGAVDATRLLSPPASFAAYIAAKQAHLPVTTLPEGEDFSGLGLLIVPSALSFSEETWAALSAFVQDGGTIVCSLDDGELPAEARELLGVEYLGDDGRRGVLSCRVAQPGAVGELHAFDADIDVGSFALLASAGAAVIATDEAGNPLLTLNLHGKGRAAAVACPIEHAVARADSGVGREQASNLMRLYLAALGSTAGCALPVSCDRPAVEAAVMAGDEDDLILLVNHSPRPVVATVSAAQSFGEVTDMRTGVGAHVGGTSFGVPLGANDGAAVKLTWL